VPIAGIEDINYQAMAQQGGLTLLCESYPSDQNKRKDILEIIARSILSSEIGISIADEELYLLLDEAVANAMEHGNGWDPDKKIIVAVTAYPDNMRISITDEGKGFNTAEIASNWERRGRLSERGRGIIIIKQFCKISWNKKGNRINLIIKRKGGS
jgi:anti-sigma regulatory factor (Ser/Thr protein kinase)